MKNLFITLFACLPLTVTAQKATMFSTTHTERWVKSTVKTQALAKADIKI